MKKNICLLFGFILLGSSAMCLADGKVHATGKAAIVKSFVQIARDRALDNAKRLAVEQSVQVFIKSETLVQNYELIYDRILARYTGYIDSFEIIEDRSEGDQYIVTIEAVVKTAILNDELDQLLQSLLTEKSNPRLVVLFPEKNPQAFVAESVLINYFLEKGFKMIDSKNVRTQMTAGWLENVEKDKEKIQRLGQHYGAEILVLGDVLASSNAFSVEGVEMYANRAQVTARIIQVDTGELTAVASNEQKLPGIKDMTREPIERASLIVAQELTGKMIAWWQNELHQTLAVTLLVDGLSSYQEAMELQERLLQEVRGVQNIHQRLFEKSHLELEVRLKGKTDFLAHDLVHFKIGGKTCQVVNQTANILAIKLEQ